MSGAENARFATLATRTGLMFAAMSVLGLATSILLARLLGAEALGIYASAFALISFLTVLTNSGITPALIRLLATYRAQGKGGLIRGCITWAYGHVLALATLGGALIAAAVAVSDWPGTQAKATYLLAFVLLPLWGVVAVQSGILQGLDRVVQARTADLLIRPGALVLILAAWLALNSHVSPINPATWAMAANVIAFVLALVIGAVLVRRCTPALSSSVMRQYEMGSWYRICLSLTASEIAEAAMAQCTLIILPVFADASEVGLLRVALSVSVVASMPYVAVTAPMPAAIARCLAENRGADLQRLLTSAARLSFLLCLPIALALFVGGRTILELLYGAEFGAAYSLLAILTMGQLVTVGAGLSVWVLRLSGNARSEAGLTAIVAMSQLAVTLALAPLFGAVGAACVHAVCGALRVIAIVYLTIIRTKINPLFMK